jgi:hypothetical protein
MILNARQRKAFEQGIAASNNVLPQLEWLEQLANVHPVIRERVQDLRTKRDYLKHLSETALEAERIVSDNT